MTYYDIINCSRFEVMSYIYTIIDLVSVIFDDFFVPVQDVDVSIFIFICHVTYVNTQGYVNIKSLFNFIYC